MSFNTVMELTKYKYNPIMSRAQVSFVTACAGGNYALFLAVLFVYRMEYDTGTYY